jgi:hypothetical protein
MWMQQRKSPDIQQTLCEHVRLTIELKRVAKDGIARAEAGLLREARSLERSAKGLLRKIDAIEERFRP